MLFLFVPNITNGTGSNVGSGTGLGNSGNSSNKSSFNTGDSSREGQEDGSMYKGSEESSTYKSSEFNAKQVRQIFFECMLFLFVPNLTNKKIHH